MKRSLRLMIAVAACLCAVNARGAADVNACDEGILKLKVAGADGYQERGKDATTRWEGFYAQPLAADSTLRLTSLAYGWKLPERTPKQVALSWHAPPNAKAVRLRAVPLGRKEYFRMDAARPAAEPPFLWTLDVCAKLESVRKQFLGVTAWTADGPDKQVYLPLTIAQTDPAPTPDPASASKELPSLEARFTPQRELSQVVWTLARVKSDSAAPAVPVPVPVPVDLDMAPYPAQQPFRIIIKRPLLADGGFYCLTIGSTTQHKAQIETIAIKFYVPGK